MASLKILFCYILCTVMVFGKEYRDDSEYDFDFYEDLSEDRVGNFYKRRIGAAPEDYYDEAVGNQRNAYPKSQDHLTAFGNNVDSFERNLFAEHLDWYELPRKVYRYTKHRIPGYDYDEFASIGSRGYQECDDRSIWTHCLCQFTCTEPDVVDCYTPCRSGCECKEDYVFDEIRQKCLTPEQCWSDKEEEGKDFNYQI
ncbi:PREDICTED: uncharacterized protein LOC106743744 [Dinoponera quadriceps]|uniref:Uncharacterized protein LOC106743744 n=1 Tax=Dinoponera quadriceps TaxID=609295 RepID=A0A6P3X528_DINQU|nr:PREDICTED: uncharacterized protein LOC106743744 [Dinoponera quadriceps]